MSEHHPEQDSEQDSGPASEADSEQYSGRHEAVAPKAAQRSAGTPSTSGDSPSSIGFWAELRDAVAPRTVAIVVGVLLLQLGFILSYVGAFHHPEPHRIPVSVVAPSSAAGQVVRQLNAIEGKPVLATAASDEAAARGRMKEGSSSAALLVDPAGTKDTLLIATGGGVSVATAAQEVLTRAEASQQRTLSVQDVVPLESGDGRGLTGFYLVIGWIVGGYLVAALLGVAKGSRPATARRAVFRLAAVVPYALLSGLGGALIVGPLLGALTGHLGALWALGTLIVFSAAAVTLAFQVLFGVIGIGVTVLLFVVLGNPSAGGAYQPALLPPFWRSLSGALPNGAGTDAVRRIVYFGAHGTTGPVLVITAYAVAGAIVAYAGSSIAQRRGTAVLAEPEVLGTAQGA